MRSLAHGRIWSWSPGLYDFSRLCSLAVILVSLFSLALHLGGHLDTPMAKMLVEVPAAAALSFLLLAFSLRLGSRGAAPSRIALLCAAAAALLTLLDSVPGALGPAQAKTPFLLAACHSMLATVLMLRSDPRTDFARRVLGASTALTGSWFLAANLYGLSGDAAWMSDPLSAGMVLLLCTALLMQEPGRGLVPQGAGNIFGPGPSIALLAAAFAVPTLLGWLLLGAQRRLGWHENVSMALHVLSTFCVMAVLLLAAMHTARSRLLEEQLRKREFEQAERILSGLLEQGSEVMLKLDLSGRLLGASPNACRYLRMPLGAHLRDLLMPASAGPLLDCGRSLLDALAANAVLQFRSQSGEALPLLIHAARHRLDGQDRILLVGRALPLGLRPSGSSESLLSRAG